MPGKAYSSDSPEDVVANILNLRMKPAEVADSAYRYIYMWNVEHPGELYKELEEAYSVKLIPYAEKNAIDAADLSRYYDALAQMQMRQGVTRLDEAIANYNKALSYAEEAKDYFRQGRILEHLSLTESRHGDIAKGYDLARRAIEAYKKSNGDADKYIVRCYYYQATNYLQVNDADGLGKVIDNMRAFVNEAKTENRNFVLYNIYSVEEAYYGTMFDASAGSDRKKYAELFNRATLNTIQLLESSDPEYWKGTSVNPVWNYYNRAVMFINCYDRPPMDSVKYYLDKALAINLDNKIDDIHEIQLSVAHLLAEAWIKNGNYKEAKDILLSAVDMLQSTEGINNILIDKIDIYRNLQEIARQTGHNEDAFAYADSVNSLERQRFSIEKATAIKNLEIQYQTKETELALSQSEARRANTLMWLFGVVGLLLIAIVIFIIYAGRQRRRRMQREVDFANLRADINQQLTRQYVEGLENERQRMSRELHDGVCNDLLAIQMNISGGKPIETTAAMIENCRESVRRISHELMPPEFSYASVDEVIRFFVMKQAEANEGRIVITYVSEGSGWSAVPDAVALEIYRIVQESVGNAIKHSGASSIEVNLMFNGELLVAKICDNGTYKPAPRKGLGLESIRRRSRSINGRVEVSSDENGGTIVTISVNI